ncbi:MAG TPA: extracellular solute-binding protein [bacterium]|nr:extracellular solute-binding protein [bacterium]
MRTARSVLCRLVGIVTLAVLIGTPYLTGGSPSFAAPTVDVDITKPVTITFWHIYSAGDAQALIGLIDLFHKKYPTITINAQFVAGYGQLHQKIVAALQANQPPNIALGYENDVLEYSRSGQIVDLTPYSASPQNGLDRASLGDIIPIELYRNTYRALGARYYSWPWTAAVAVMYYNKAMLAKVGARTPPATWEAFTRTCEALKKQLGKACYAIAVDASTFNDVGFSYGGRILQPGGKATDFGSMAWTETLRLHRLLVDQGYGYPTIGRAEIAFADQQDFANQQVAFIIRTSRSIPYVKQIVGTQFDWGVAIPPRAETVGHPVTVLYGPNVAVFKGSPEQQLASWLFARFASSAEGQAYWATHTGNLPTRLSTAKQDEYRQFLEKEPRFKAAFDALPYGQLEALIYDRQLVAVLPTRLRTLIEDTETALLTKAIGVSEAQARLKDQGDQILSDARK